MNVVWFGISRIGSWFRIASIVLPALLMCSSIASAASVAVWGDTRYHETNVPPNLTNAVAISAGGGFIAAARDDGSVVIWGTASTNLPAGLSNVVSISCGGSHCLALQDNGNVVAWSVSGSPSGYGETNVPAKLGHCVALGKLQGYLSLVVLDGGRVAAWGQNTYGATNVPADLSNVVAVCGASDSALALKRDGTVTGWGKGDFSLINKLTNIVAVEGSCASGWALAFDGNVISWSSTNRLVVPSQASPAVAISRNIALKRDGSVVAWGDNTRYQTNVPASVTNAIAVSGGGTFNVALVGDGSPMVVREPLDAMVDDSTDVFFNVGGVGRNIQIQWQWNGSDIDNATNETLALTGCTPLQNGTYTAVIRNDMGLVKSRDALLAVNANPPTILTNPVGKLVFPGTNVTLTGSASGPRPISYQWQRNGAPVAGATNSTLVLSNVQVAIEGNYQLAASNRFGVTLSSNALVNVVGLDDALNATQLTWVTNGNIAWRVQTNVTHDGFAAGACGPQIYNQSEALLQTIVTGPGKLSFWWEGVNVPFTSESFVFYLDAQKISAVKSSWQQVTVYVPDGLHQLSWWIGNFDYVAKTYNPTGYLDQVSYLPGTFPVAITQNPGAQTVAAGSAVTFSVSATGTPNLAYQWRFNSSDLPGATNSSLTLTDVQDNQAGSYCVSVVNAVGTAVSSNAALVVNAAAPSFVTAPSAQSATVGSVAVFSAKFKGTEPISCQWLFNDVAIEGATNSSLSISNVQILNSGNYSVALSNAFGSVSSPDVPLTIATPQLSPVITSQPSSGTLAAGSRGSFSVSAIGAAPLRYQWQLNGDAIPGATGGAYVVANAQAPNQGDYTVIVANDFGSVISSNATLVVTPKAVFFWFGPADCASPLGGQAVLDSSVSGSMPIAFQWLKDGGVLSDQTNSSLVISNVQSSDVGGYCVIATNVYGAVTSRVAQLNISGMVVADCWSPQNSFFGVPNDVVAIAGGDPYHSLALRTNGSILEWTNVNYVGAVTYFPSGLSNIQNIASGVDFNLALNKGGTVGGWGNYGAGLEVLPLGLTNIIALSACDAHSLALRQDGSLVVWGIRYNSTPPTIPLNPGPFVAIAAGEFNDAAIREDGSVVFWGANGETVHVPDRPMGAAVAVATGKTGNWTVTEDGVATLWDFAGNRVYSESNIVSIGTGSTAFATDDFAILLSANGTLSEWGIFGTLPSFSARLTNVVAICATDMHYMALINDGSPFVARSPLNRSVPDGGSAVMSVAAMGAQPLGYQWQLNGVKLQGATNAALLLDGVTASSAGMYQCVVSNSLGTVVSAPARLAIRSRPAFDIVGPVANGEVSLQASGFSAHGNIVLSASTDLASWTAIQTNSPTTGAVRFEIPVDNRQSAVFYRVIEQ